LQVRKFCDHYYARKGVMRENLEILPPKLRKQLLLFENAAFLATFSRLHVAGKEDLVHRLADLVRPCYVVAGAYYVDGEVDVCAELVFVSEGEIAILPRHRGSSRRTGDRRTRSTSLTLDSSGMPPTPGREAATLRGSARFLGKLLNFGSSAEASASSPADAAPGPAAAASAPSTLLSAHLASVAVERDSRSTDEITPSPRTPGGGRLNSAPVGAKKAGSWFGHKELLAAYRSAQDSGDDAAMVNDIPWKHSYKARVPTELLLLIKDELFLLLEEFPFLYDLLDSEPLVDDSPSPPPRRGRKPDAELGGVSTASASNVVVDIEVGAAETPPACSSSPPRGLSPIPASPREKLTPVAAAAGEERDDAATDSSLGGGALEALEASALEASDAPLEVSATVGGADGSVPMSPPKRSLLRKTYGSSGSLGGAMSGGASLQRASSSTGMGMAGLKSGAHGPKLSTSCDPSPGAASARANWQKLRRSKASTIPSPPSSPTIGSTSADAEGAIKGAGGGAAAAGRPWASEFLKQRIACELLGEPMSAPWQIDEVDLFSRLKSLIGRANAVIESRASSPASLASSSGGQTPPPSLGGAGHVATTHLELHQLLLSMQRTVQEKADEVRCFLDDADDPGRRSGTR
jgi:hypothetical protein